MESDDNEEEIQNADGQCELCGRICWLPDGIHCKECIDKIKVGGVWGTG